MPSRMIEIIIVIAIIGILSGVSFPFYHAISAKNDLSITATSIAQMCRRAQTLSQSGKLDDTWGVKILSGSIILFVGSDYVSRDTSQDQVISISNNVSISGVDELVFSKLLGDPDTTGTITLESGTGEQQTVTINSKGVVSY